LPIETSGGDEVLSRKVVEIGAGRGFFKHPQFKPSGDSPDVPVMPETLLLLELNAQACSVDLREMTQVVLGDPGATIQILREGGRECSFGEEPPNRIEDCISALGVRTCIEAVSRRIVSRAMNKPAIMRAWSHSRKIAETCKLIAEEASQNIDPDEAYLTGLLHELGTLPAILDWAPALAVSSDPVLTGLRLAEEWFLPQCVVEYFSEPGHQRGVGRWTGIVQCAHEISESWSDGSQFDGKQESRVVAFGQ
jgi:hypothetical protein